MMKRRASCMVCDYTPVCIAGWWTFMPTFCCETKNIRRIAHRKKAGK